MWLALAVQAVAVAPASAGNGVIYKCFDSHLNLVYTDLPCKDGEQLDIRAGDADPVAVARLDHALDLLDEMTMQRLLDERRASARDYAIWPTPEPSPPPSTADTFDYGSGYGYLWYPPYRRPFPRPPQPKPHVTPGFGSGPIPRM